MKPALNPALQALMQAAARRATVAPSPGLDPQALMQGVRDALGRHGLADLPGLPDLSSLPGLGHLPQAPARAARTPAPLQDGERFVDLAVTHAGRTTHHARLYTPPPSAAPGPRPLVVMLHGCTQDPDDFAAGTAMNLHARAAGAYVLYPAQDAGANPQRCWNWFKHSHQVRDRGEPAWIAAATRQVMADHPIDPARVFVAGLSAGGAMAAILGAAYPELYAAVGVHSGLAVGAARDMPGAFAAMRGAAAMPGGAMPMTMPMPAQAPMTPAQPSPSTASSRPVRTIVFHGDADATVHPSNGHHVLDAASPRGEDVVVSDEHGAVAGGRSYTRTVHTGRDGRVLAEHWSVQGAPHAWSGGSAEGSYTDPRGPDASAEMLRFFLGDVRSAR